MSSLLYAKWTLSSQIHFVDITLWGLPATQKALYNCFYMTSKQAVVWKSPGCACKQQSWYVGDHWYGQFYRRKNKKQLELFVFTRRSVSNLLVKRTCLFVPSFLFFVQHYRTTSRGKRLDLHSSGDGKGINKQIKNKTSDHKQLIWLNVIRPVLLPPAGQGVTAQSATQRLRRHLLQGNSSFP